MTRADGLQGFVKQLSGWHRLARMLSTFVQHGLVLGIAVGILDFVNGAYTSWALLIAILWLVTVSLSSYLTSTLKPQVADEQLGLQDGLTTWLNVSVEGRDRPMVAWLERDLDDRLAQVSTPEIRWMGLRRLGLLRYLVPILVLILLLRVFPPLPLPDGPVAMAGTAGGQGGSKSGDEGDEPAAGGGGADEETEDESESTEPEAGPEEKEPEPEPDTPPPPDNGTQKPEDPEEDDGLGKEHDLLDLKTEDSFAIPQFIGEGPSTKEEALVAKEVVSEGKPPEPDPKPKGGHKEGEPEPEQAEFERAQERALRSRHIPVEERPMVKSYFRSLLEGRR